MLSSQIIGVLIISIVIITLLMIAVFLACYKKCPADKILVLYGKVSPGKNGVKRSSMCIHGGAVMVWPLIQSYQFLDLNPISIDIDLKAAIDKNKTRVNIPSRFTVGISTEVGVMQNAAERLLGLSLNDIQELAKDIIFGQLRLVIAAMKVDEMDENRDKFLDIVSRNVETELKKIGLHLINVNITDILIANKS